MISFQVRPGFAIVASLFAFALFTSALAEIPRMISYQGKVTDSGGTPVADGTYTMRFRLYDAATGGILEWDSGNRSIAVSDGVFNVLLGESPQPSLNLPFGEDYWLLVTFSGVNQTPRQRLASMGYAYMASGLVPGTEIEGSVTSGYASAIWAANSATWGTSFGGYFLSASSSGRGVYGHASHASGTTYGGKFHSNSTSGRGCYGWATATTGTNYGGYFESSSSSGRGVYGEAPEVGVRGYASATTGYAYGGWFESASTQGSGVRAYATSTTGDYVTYGVYGRSDGDTGRGVYGYASATTGGTYGVYGESASDDGTGGYFRSNGSLGCGVDGYAPLVGVRGYASATTGETYGGTFQSASEDGHGVCGYASATTGYTYGGYFESASEDGYGVYGYASSTADTTFGGYFKNISSSGTGVCGIASGTTGGTCGVYGRSASSGGYGVYGLVSATTGYNYGVYGSSLSNAGTGVYGEGDYRGGRFADGTSDSYCYSGYSTYKTYGTGTNAFVQNHPRDNDRVIVYAAPEGDEVATYTRGTARLENGEARVALGETFRWVTNPDIGLTAHLTPRGKCEGLYVESLTTEEMVIREQRDGSSDVTFDYIVYGLRIGFEEVSIVQEKQEESYVPSMADHRELYVRHPELRIYNALERFKSMRAARGETEPFEMSSSGMLLNSIQEYDPAVHGTAMAEDVRTKRARTKERLDRLEEHRHPRREQHAHRETEQAITDEDEGR